MPVWLSTAISVIGCVISVSTFYMKIRNDMKAEREAERDEISREIKAVRASISSMEKKLDERVSLCEEDMASLRTKHEADMQGMELLIERKNHELYMSMETERNASAQGTAERLSNLEGKVTAKLESLEKSVNTLMDFIMRQKV